MHFAALHFKHKNRSAACAAEQGVMSFLDDSSMNRDKNKYYMLWFLASSLYSLIIFYCVLILMKEYSATGQIEFSPKEGIMLNGSPAIIACAAVFFTGILSTILAIDSYKKFSRNNKKS